MHRWWSLLLLGGLGLSQALYIPLDNRPPNWTPCNWGLVVCPPPELYRGREGASPSELARWLEATSGQQLLLSVDALVYGGLVQSRTSDISAVEAQRRLEAVSRWKSQNKATVLGFGVIPRHPDATHRERNLEVLRNLSGLDYAEAIWDDALPPSPAVAEAATLNLPTRPGADEGGQMMLLRSLNRGLRVKVLYDAPEVARQNIRYDGIPLTESVERLVASTDGILVERNPDVVLVAYTGTDPRQGLLTVLQGLREAPVALADLSSVNRGDAVLVRYLVGLGIFSNLASYAAWGTPSNNLGAALAQGGLFAPSLCRRAGLEAMRCETLRQQALAQAYLEYLWGEVGRPWVRARFPEPLTEEASRYVFERLRTEPTPVFSIGKLELLGLSFPWQRSFEAGWAYRFSKQ